MKESDDKGGGIRLSNAPRTNRDDTPSIIRDVERLTSIPSRNSLSRIPVLEMPKSQRIWRRIRIPLFVTIVAILLLTVAIITRGIKVASSIANTIDEALVLEAKGTIEQTRLAEKMLAKLSEKHPGDETAAAGWAWQTVLQKILYGEPLPENVKEVLTDIDGTSAPFAFAARAGNAYLAGDLKGALEIATEGLAKTPQDPRISLIQIVAMNGLGRREDAWNRLLEVLESDSAYLPLIIVGAMTALGNGDRLDALELSKTLLAASPGNLYGEMLIIHLGLPAWGEPVMASKQHAVLQKKYQAISPRMGAAPPALKNMGHYLRGRLFLVAGNPKEAIAAFKLALAGKKSSEILAWYAKAVRLESNVTDALAVLDQHKALEGPASWDIHAQLLLEYHRVKQAAKVLEKLKASNALPQRIKELAWILAVRSGDTAAAKSRLPKKITGDQKWPALEMYFLLKREGDTKGLDALVQALEGEWGTCARVIRSWHSRSLRRATRLFGNKRVTCADDMMPRLMLGKLPIAMVAEAAEQVHEKSGANALFEVDRALAAWRTQGYTVGLQMLDAITALKPEGEPLLRSLAHAYIEMDAQTKALAVLGDADSPELLSLRIQALEASKQRSAAAKLIKTAVKRSDQSKHPVYTYYKLRQLMKKRDASAVQTWIQDNLSKTLYGEWTAEIAELCARALIALDLRPEEEDLLQQVSKRLLVPAGADEAIDAWTVDVKLSINKGGRLKNRALVIIRTLREEGVKDPRFAFWLGEENITNGSERLGLKFIREALDLDPAFKPGWAKMAEMEWMGEQTAGRMRHVLPEYNPPGAPLSNN